MIVSGPVCRSALSLCAWSTACSSVTVQETPWRRNATCAASSPVTIGPMCPLLPRNVFTIWVSTRQPVSICTEVTLVHHCFPLDNLETTTRDTIWYRGLCTTYNMKCFELWIWHFARNVSYSQFWSWTFRCPRSSVYVLQRHLSCQIPFLFVCFCLQKNDTTTGHQSRESHSIHSAFK